MRAGDDSDVTVKKKTKQHYSLEALLREKRRSDRQTKDVSPQEIAEMAIDSQLDEDEQARGGQGAHSSDMVVTQSTFDAVTCNMEWEPTDSDNHASMTRRDLERLLGPKQADVLQSLLRDGSSESDGEVEDGKDKVWIPLWDPAMQANRHQPSIMPLLAVSGSPILDGLKRAVDSNGMVYVRSSCSIA